MASSIYVKTLPQSLGQKTAVSKGRKFITPQLQVQLMKRKGEWKLLKKNTSSSELSRLRKQAKALGLKVEFVSTASKRTVSANGRTYYKVTGDIYASYQK